MFRITAALVFTLSFAACAGKVEEPTLTDAQLAQTVGQDLVGACPVAPPSDLDAREACATRLADLASLRDRLSEPVLWGGQKSGMGYDLAKSALTRFNPMVWRKMYLSLFTFDGTFTVEQAGGLTVLHVPAHFRNALDAGAYPYPFWHSKRKWDSYQQSAELLFVVEGGVITGVLRSASEEPQRPHVDHAWDGIWSWADDRGEEPRVSLYQYLFKPGNPKVEELDAAYRNLEYALRQHDCQSCHSPDNQAQMNPLELFSYPNQALASRHRLVAKIEANQMPPGGIASEVQRLQLLQLARDFEATAEQALLLEGENMAGDLAATAR